MFVRKKKNHSGSTSVVVADKNSGSFTELKVISVGTTEGEIPLLCWEANRGLLIKEVNRPYYFLMRRQSNSNRRRSDDEHILSNIIGTSLNSPQTIINKVYDKIGFNAIQGEELRESGFSKDGKNSNPQVVLGLLVSRGGYPLFYSLFNGSQYEGYTMIPIVDDFVQRFYDERAKKNAHDRDEDVMRLRKRYAKGTLTKADINKRGYNKFLSVSSGVTVSIVTRRSRRMLYGTVIPYHQENVGCQTDVPLYSPKDRSPCLHLLCCTESL